MKTIFTNNTLTVVTPISHAVAEKGIADLATYDKDKNVKFQVSVSDKASISKFGIACNAVVEGNLAAVIVMPIGTTKEDVMKKYGKSLVAAKPELEAIATKAAEDEAAIAAIFE